jgi:4-diphosphocytidyl-2-C-methyl-D-erythritol kinase
MIVVERAPAKINLSLHVGEAALLGRHPLESVVAFADIADEVTAEPNGEGGLRLHVEGPFADDLAEEPDNLVLRAARELALEGAMRKPSARLTLEKILPVASGIGGGSADAAAALRALNRLWRLNASIEDLERVAWRLGADVPVCVRSNPAFMFGTGEQAISIDLPVFDAVLVNPDCALPTAAVYQTFDAMRLGGNFVRSKPPAWTSAREALSSLRDSRNDLTEAAFELAPEVGEALACLSSDPRALLTRMSGSGATVFALCVDAPAAAGLADAVRRVEPNWWIRSARLGAVDVLSQGR